MKTKLRSTKFEKSQKQFHKYDVLCQKWWIYFQSNESKSKQQKKILKFSRIFKISSKNLVFINKKLDALHEQKKLKWTMRFISYVFSMFVIWFKIQTQEKKIKRKGRVVMNIRRLNKMSELNAYFMSF